MPRFPMSTLNAYEPLPTADEALQRLIDGNRRFLRGEARFPTVQKEILASLAPVSYTHLDVYKRQAQGNEPT